MKKIIRSRESDREAEYFRGDDLFAPVHRRKGIPIGNLTSQFFANLYLNDFEVVKKLIQSKNLNKENIRFFLGYSGWHANQLDDELAENAWVVSEIDPMEVMSPMTRHFWKNTLKKLKIIPVIIPKIKR